MRPTAVCLLASLALAPPASAQAVDVDEDAIDELFDEWDSRRTPGAIVAVIHAGELVFQRAYGMADIRGRVELEPDMAFPIGEATRHFTTSALGQLALEGELDAEAELKDAFPELELIDQAVRVRDLLAQTDGLNDPRVLWRLSGEERCDELTREAALASVLRQRGSGWVEGGEQRNSTLANWLMLDELLRRESESAVGDVLQERFFGPLGMEQTRYVDALQLDQPEFLSYVRADDGLEPACDTGRWHDPGLFTSVADLVRWEQELLRRDEEGGELDAWLQSFSSESLSTLGRALPHLELREYRGLSCQALDARWGSGFAYLRIPDAQLAVICFTNNWGLLPAAQARRVAEQCIEFPGDPPRGRFGARNFPDLGDRLPPERIDALLGRYESADLGGALYRLTESRGQLSLRLPDRSKHGAVAFEDGILLPRSSLTLRFDPDSADVLILETTGASGVRLERVR